MAPRKRAAPSVNATIDSNRCRGGRGGTSKQATSVKARFDSNSYNGARDPLPDGPFLADVHLGMLAAVVDDLEHARIAQENRLNAFKKTHPDQSTDLFDAILEIAQTAEHAAILKLRRAMRRHPLWPWAKGIKGLGEKQFARLLGAIGDPYWNDGFYPDPSGAKDEDGKPVMLRHNRPRTVRGLRKYCGYHVWDDGTAPHPEDRTQNDWKGDARTRTRRITESLLKCGDPTYRAVYDKERVRVADSVHVDVCKPCGPKGKPAKAGSPRSLALAPARDGAAQDRQ